MKTLRIFLMAALFLVVFGIDGAEAIQEKEPEWSYEAGGTVISIAFSAEGDIVLGSYDDKVYFFDKGNSTPIWNYTAGDNIRKVDISADGEYIVASSRDNFLYFWNKESSTPVWSYTNGEPFSGAAMSSDGEYIAASDWGGTLYLFGKDSGTPIWTYDVGDLMRVDISDDGGYIVAASNNNNFYLFNKNSSTPLWTYTDESQAWEIKISADGQYIAAASDPSGSLGEVYFFHRDSNTPLWNHSIGLWPTLSISDNGDYIVAGDWNSGNISLFGKDSGDPIWQFDAPNGCRKVSISADGRYITGSVGSGNSGQAFLWNKNSSVPLWTNYTKDDEYVLLTQISDDGRYVGIGTQPDGFYLFDNIVLKNWDLEVGAYSVAITDDGNLVAVGDDSGWVHLIDNKDGTTIWSYEAYSYIDNIATSSDGTYIAAGGNDYRVYLFNKESSTPLWYSELDERVLSLDMSADGSYIVACAQNPDRRIYLFSKDSSTPVWTYRTSGNVYDVDISLDGEYIAAISTSDNAVRVFNKESNEPLWTNYMEEQGQVIEMSDDSNYLVVGSGEKVHLFDTLTGELLWDYDIGNTIREIDLSSNGSHIIVSGSSGKRYNDKLFLFNKNSSTPLWSYQTEGTENADPGAVIGDVEISSDGKIIVGISVNGKIYLFYPQSNVPMWSSKVAEQSGYLISMTPDGSSFIAHCVDRDQLCSFKHIHSDYVNLPPPLNRAPVIEDLNVEQRFEGVMYDFEVDAFDEDGDDLEYFWDMGDGGTEKEGKTVRYAYQDDGVYTVRVSVYDGEFTTEKEFEIIVDNIDPILEVAYDNVANEGSQISFASQVDDVASDEVTVRWSFPDGTIAEGTFAQYTFRDDGEYLVTVVAEDDDDGRTEQQLPITINNVAPVFTIFVTPIGGEASITVDFIVSATDPGDDTITYTFDFGDDTAIMLSLDGNISHKFVEEGTFTVIICAKDEDGGETCRTETIPIASFELETEEETEEETPCQSGATKIADDGCNQCVCSEGEWICTEIACENPEKEESLLPSVSMIPALISIGLIAIFRRK